MERKTLKQHKSKFNTFFALSIIIIIIKDTTSWWLSMISRWCKRMMLENKSSKPIKKRVRFISTKISEQRDKRTKESNTKERRKASRVTCKGLRRASKSNRLRFNWGWREERAISRWWKSKVVRSSLTPLDIHIALVESTQLLRESINGNKNIINERNRKRQWRNGNISTMGRLSSILVRIRRKGRCKLLRASTRRILRK